VFFILCLVADFHEISNRFFKFLWDGSDFEAVMASINDRLDVRLFALFAGKDKI